MRRMRTERTLPSLPERDVTGISTFSDSTPGCPRIVFRFPFFPVISNKVRNLLAKSECIQMLHSVQHDSWISGPRFSDRLPQQKKGIRCSLSNTSSEQRIPRPVPVRYRYFFSFSKSRISVSNWISAGGAGGVAGLASSSFFLRVVSALTPFTSKNTAKAMIRKSNTTCTKLP